VESAQGQHTAMSSPGRGFQPDDALIVVDVQRDFLPGGALGVAGGEEVIPVLNRCAAECDRRGLPVFATQDWHPPDHCSFQAQGGPWPVHCVAGTSGAELAPALALPQRTHIVSKATTREKDAYSAFQDTDLTLRLRQLGCRRVLIGGLATDYCVRATALDALQAGFEVVVLLDAIRPVEASPGDGARALAELRARGADVLAVEELLE
jgi:nicotinamidase/pyrazinamidase